METWCEVLENDGGWNTQAFDGADELTPARNKILRTKIINRNLLCASGGNIYVFLPTINIWCIMCSRQAIVYMNTLMSMESASVNYVDAFAPYVEYLERHAVDNVARPIPTSICIGTSRLRVTYTKTGLEMTMCESLVPTFPDKAYEIPSRLCHTSLASRIWVPQWERTDSFPLYRYISPLFTNPIEMLTFEWCLGNALVDPHSFSKAVILYGEGGKGKSTVLAALNTAFAGCCGNIPDGALVSLSKGMPPVVASIVASNRIVTAGDVGNANESTNLSVVKSITGHDYISLPPSRAKTSCTLVYATNRLDNPRENVEWATAAITRRVVVIVMDAVLNGILGDPPQDNISRLDYFNRCVHTRLKYPDMPVSSMSVLISIVGSQLDSLSDFVVPDDPDNIDDNDVITANAIVGAYINRSAEEVGHLAKCMSASAVCTIRGKYYIKGIAPQYSSTE